MSAFIEGEFFNLLSCGKCGVRWLVPTGFDHEKRESGGSFYCPNGHPSVYRETENAKLKRERDRLAQDIARAQDEKLDAERRADAAAKALIRHKKRAANGTCPCCKRTFANMARHMTSKHPDFVVRANVVALKEKFA